MLPTGWLCREHLLGEHGEVHQLAGTMANHPHGLAVIEGLADGYPLDMALLPQRHAELAAEMGARGYDHDSGLQDYEDPGLGSFEADDVRANLAGLLRRCPDCAERYARDDHAEYRLGSRIRFVGRFDPAAVSVR